MDTTPERLLAKHTSLRTNSLKVFHAYIVGIEGPLERQLIESESAEFEIRRASLGKIAVGVCFHSVAMHVEATRSSSASYLVQFPLTGGFHLDIDGRQVSVASGAGVVISPRQRVSRSASPGWTLVFSIPSELLRARLERRLGHSLTEALLFQSLISSGARDLLGYALLAVEAIDRGMAFQMSPVAVALQDGFLDLLLDLQPHSYGQELVDSEAEMRSRRISALTDYLADHYRESFSVRRLARIAGCSVRSLQAAFSELCGMSPLEYVQRYRLALVRDWLDSGEANATVSDLAGRAGFAHLGRFSTQYKARYGESPSETMRRVRVLRKKAGATSKRVE